MKDPKLSLPPLRPPRPQSGPHSEQPGPGSTPSLQALLGHEFASADLLQQALTHRSHSLVHNERLEFLGDSVLNCIVASLLFDKFGKIDEGDLSRLRANLVKQQSLYEIAQRLELSQYLRLGEGELKSGGFRRPSILADTVEALFGAVFLDGGFEAARGTIAKLYRPILATVDPKTLGKDSKTLLQEYLQSRKLPLPTYAVTATHGAAHNQEFEVECAVAKLAIQVQGSGGSRRAAEQAAAKKALEQALALALSAGKRARKPRQSQLSLPVAVEQAPAPQESSVAPRLDLPAADGAAFEAPQSEPLEFAPPAEAGADSHPQEQTAALLSEVAGPAAANSPEDPATSDAALQGGATGQAQDAPAGATGSERESGAETAVESGPEIDLRVEPQAAPLSPADADDDRREISVFPMTRVA